MTQEEKNMIVMRKEIDRLEAIILSLWNHNKQLINHLEGKSLFKLMLRRLGIIHFYDK